MNTFSSNALYEKALQCYIQYLKNGSYFKDSFFDNSEQMATSLNKTYTFAISMEDAILRYAVSLLNQLVSMKCACKSYWVLIPAAFYDKGFEEICQKVSSARARTGDLSRVKRT